MNVLMTCAQDSGLGGVQHVFRDLVKQLEQNGRHVELIYDAPLPRVRITTRINGFGRTAFYCPMAAIVKDNIFVSLPVFVAYLPSTLFQLARLIRRKKIDVINCHYLAPYFIHLVMAARLLRIPVVVSVHGADIDNYAVSSPGHRLVYRLIMRGAQRIVACSGALAKRTVDVFPEVRHKVTYVHNGLDPAPCGVARAPRQLPQNFLLSVCRHVHKKGIDTLLHAFALVSREVQTLSLVLVGDGPLLEEHKLLARTLGIQDRVAFMGSVAHDDLSDFFSACALFVLPSRDEPFGLVLLEASDHRKGIVCTRVGGVPEIITDGVNGRMVESDDPAAMAAQILTLLRDPDFAAQLGRHAYQTLMTRFLWKQRVLDYIAIFQGDPGPSWPYMSEVSSMPSAVGRLLLVVMLGFLE